MKNPEVISQKQRRELNLNLLNANSVFLFAELTL